MIDDDFGETCVFQTTYMPADEWFRCRLFRSGLGVWLVQGASFLRVPAASIIAFMAVLVWDGLYSGLTLNHWARLSSKRTILKVLKHQVNRFRTISVSSCGFVACPDLKLIHHGHLM